MGSWVSGEIDGRGHYLLLLGVFVSSANRLTVLVEVKTLKALVRNVIDPKRDLGHTDRALKKKEEEEEENAKKKGEGQKDGKEACEDCK